MKSLLLSLVALLLLATTSHAQCGQAIQPPVGAGVSSFQSFITFTPFAQQVPPGFLIVQPTNGALLGNPYANVGLGGFGTTNFGFAGGSFGFGGGRFGVFSGRHLIRR